MFFKKKKEDSGPSEEDLLYAAEEQSLKLAKEELQIAENEMQKGNCKLSPFEDNVCSEECIHYKHGFVYDIPNGLFDDRPVVYKIKKPRCKLWRD